MIRLGIIGGVSFESTLHYYKRINEIVNQAMGQLITADLVITSENFQIIKQWQDSECWDEIGMHLAKKAMGMKNMGVEKLIVSSTTTHRIVPILEREIGLPVIHIVDCLAEKLVNDMKQSVIFLGTKITMTQDYLLDKLRDRGIVVVIPAIESDLDEVDRIIFAELCKGTISEDSRRNLIKIIEQTEKLGNFDAVILGCTELGYLLNQDHVHLPLYDMAECHIEAITDLIINSCKSSA